MLCYLGMEFAHLPEEAQTKGGLVHPGVVVEGECQLCHSFVRLFLLFFLLCSLLDVLQIRMCERLLNRHPLGGNEGQHPLQELDALLRSSGTTGRQVLAVPLVEQAHILDGICLVEMVCLPFLGGADEGEDHVQLILVALRVKSVVVGVLSVGGEGEAGSSRKERLSLGVVLFVLLHHVHHLCENAPNRPDIDGLCVVFCQENQLRSPVPSCHHVPRQLSLHVLLLVLLLWALCTPLAPTPPRRGGREVPGGWRPQSAGETEVTDFDRAVLVDKTVGGFEVSVEDSLRVDVSEFCEEVEEEGLDVEL
mmetsp:Transcript_40775/g.80346  ORF Transcript_40775/g.80346 Transcript_40775/m.80346 type:complete len:307 (-) Transcript_40775:200-1120(-)